MTEPSLYEQIDQILKDTKCRKCHGQGEVTDAEPGDISFNTYVCNTCNGSGFRPGLKTLRDLGALERILGVICHGKCNKGRL